MAWTDLTFTFGSTLSSSKMTQLDDNFDALAAGSAGAPKIQTAALEQTGGSEAVTQATIRAASIGQNEIKTALQQTSTAVFANVSYTGGGFHLGWGYGISNATNVSMAGYTSSGGYIWGMGLSVGGGATTYWQSRYFQASPPYDLGNGTVPLFVFAIVDNASGDIIAIDVAPDPPWANNGPTNVLPDIYDKSGIGYQRRIRLPGGELLHPTAIGERIRNAGRNTAVIDRELALLQAAQQAAEADPDANVVWVRVDSALKNADIDVVPHPFIGTDLTGRSVVLIDPVGSFGEKFALLHEVGEPVPIVVMDHVRIDNTPNGATAPPGVMCVNARWRGAA